MSTHKTNCVNFSLRQPFKFRNKIVYKCLECLMSHIMCTKCSEIEIVREVKYLGIFLDGELSLEKLCL